MTVGFKASDQTANTVAASSLESLWIFQKYENYDRQVRAAIHQHAGSLINIVLQQKIKRGATKSCAGATNRENSTSGTAKVMLEPCSVLCALIPEGCVTLGNGDQAQK